MKSRSGSGFTLIETLAVVLMIGILAAIGAPSWVALANGRRLNAAQEKAYLAMRQAQSNAKRDKIDWQTTFREDYNGVLQVAVHPVSVKEPTAEYWQSFDPQVHIVNYDTTLYFDDTRSFWRIQFDFKGNLYDKDFNNRRGKVVLTTDDPNSAQKKSCVIVSTLLGAMRTAQDDKCSSPN